MVFVLLNILKIRYIRGRKNPWYRCHPCSKLKVKVKVIVKVKMIMDKKQRALEIVVKIVVAALTAFVTALGTTSCMRCVM